MPSRAFSSPAGRLRSVLVAIGLAVALAGCAADPATRSGFNDPLEPANRTVHSVNKVLDRGLVRPGSQVYGHVVPGPVRTGIHNFADNLGLPAAIVNSLLQGRVEPAAQNLMRFLANSTFGLGGVLDPATDMGLTEVSTDFGATLHRWGAGEGVYVELPVMGPSTARDTVGLVVDSVIDPLNMLGSPERDYVLGADVMSQLGDRYRYTDTIDSLLYDSADSYAQSRLLYLQNRRFELGTAAEDLEYDPYENANGN